MPDVEHFITSQLNQAGIPYQITRGFVNVSCAFHPHSGVKKKLGFSKQSGGMSCWVCGKKGHWNEYAEKMGLDKFESNEARLQDFAVLRRDFDNALTGKKEPETPDWLIPWQRKSWRGLPREFIVSLPSFEWHDEGSNANRILWPVYINDKFKGCTAARIIPGDEEVWPKTRNLGGIDALKILFPFDHPLVRAAKAIVLVEGVFDALRLIYYGVPAASIMGTGAWDPHKLTLLALRGVERLILAFDGDLAGERLADTVMEQAENMFDVRMFPFPDPDESERERGIETIDPGNCKMQYVKVLKRLTRFGRNQTP